MGRDWIELAQDRDQWRALMTTKNSQSGSTSRFDSGTSEVRNRDTNCDVMFAKFIFNVNI
jgi:hypothetical protein